MPAKNTQMQKSAAQRPKKISANSNTPLITEKELLTTVPSSISYSTISHYDFFNHGKSRIPSKIFHWENFIEMVKNHSIDNVLKKYEKPSIPLSHAPITVKEELTQVIDLQLVRPLTSKLNHDDLELCKLSENLLIDWVVVNDNDQILASVASRTHRVLRTKNDDDIIKAHQQNIGDFADNVNEVYDYMCELGLKYSVLTTYEFTWFLKRSENDPSVLLISNCQKNDSNDPTILQTWNYLFHLSKKESLLTPWPTILPSVNTEYFADYPYARYSPSVENFPESSTVIYRKRQFSVEEDDYEIKNSRRREDFSEGSSSSSYATVFRSYDIIDWNNIIVKNEIGGDGFVHLVEYNGEQLVLKSAEGSDWRKIDLEKEVRMYKRLSAVQGVHIPRMKYSGFTLRNERYILATEVIEQTSTLCQRHKEEALRAIKAIHSLGVIHNDIRESNFIVGKTIDENDNEERLFIINFQSSKDFKEEQRVQLTSYHIYMEKEKEKVEELFNQLPN